MFELNRQFTFLKNDIARVSSFGLKYLSRKKWAANDAA